MFSPLPVQEPAPRPAQPDLLPRTARSGFLLYTVLRLVKGSPIFHGACWFCYNVSNKIYNNTRQYYRGTYAPQLAKRSRDSETWELPEEAAASAGSAAASAAAWPSGAAAAPAGVGTTF